MKNSYILPLAIVAAFPNSSLAQKLNSPQVENLKDSVDKAQTVVGAAGPLDRAASAISGSTFEFDTTEGETEISLALSFDLKSYKPRKVESYDTGGGRYRVGELNLVVKGAVPIEEKTTQARLFTGDSLTTGSRISLSLVGSSSLLNAGVHDDGLILELHKACVAEELSGWEGQSTEITAVEIQLRDALIVDDTSSTSIEYVGRAMNQIQQLGLDQFDDETQQSLETARDKLENSCFRGGPYAIADTLSNRNKEFREKLDAVSFVNKPTRFWGVEASFGQDDFNMLDRTAFEVSTVKRNSWEVGGYVGLIGPDIDWSVRARAIYGQRHEAAEDGKECRTIMGTIEPECITGPDGLPNKIETGIISIEGRRMFSFGEDQRFAIAPQVAYDIEDDDLRFEMPVYLAPDEDGKLSGGIKLGYSSNEDEFGIGIFVSTPFSIFF